MKSTRSDTGVWMHDTERCESVSRMVAIDAMVALGHDPDDFRLRDRIITAINTRINQTLDAVTDSDDLTRLRERVAELEAEIRKLRAIVDRLPKTADGVPVTPGMSVFVNIGDIAAVHVATDSDGRIVADLGDGIGTSVSDCYSTREAAEAAEVRVVGHETLGRVFIPGNNLHVGESSGSHGTNVRWKGTFCRNQRRQSPCRGPGGLPCG